MLGIVTVQNITELSVGFVPPIVSALWPSQL